MQSAVAVAQQSSNANGLALTIPKGKYADSIDFSNAPKHKKSKFPLSDQSNKGGWRLNSEHSDEFNGTQLDTELWYPTNPGWKGRIPTQFHPANVTIANGYANFAINQHGDDELLEGYTHSSGFLVSKNTFLYGYFEGRLKLSDNTWISGFWMSHNQPDWWTEIDICENCPGVEKNRHDFSTNIHVFKSPKDQGDVKSHFSRTAKYYIPFELQRDFHVWGLEWTEEYIRFYLDGVLIREAENTHWHQPLRININQESNKWFGALPSEDRIDELYLVDYFRVWEKK